ncbi:hypothetical protein VB715_08865 [Crocosphaera sp. UHCC 0190]|uniref:hypothetical protein n=1 Tax=Crocosphaera sp. UHCC 0190 TaxID=3110246 RepID=UPI002B1FB14A|nr:hypothetical protein [Crocosphaera sp. UHCC 0190]MEA5509873.1 hypothetical protein [Crocosphaera sp. UHCC 0190]
MSHSSQSRTSLNYYGAYHCPVCRHGEIATLPLMEAFACNFCRHIFTANLDKQAITIADSQVPLTWYWTGESWQGIRSSQRIQWGYRFFALAFVILPTTIVGLGAYLFPPLPDSPLCWFPYFWVGFTFLAHLGCIVWLILEYYQFPMALYFEALRDNFVSRG